MSWLSQILHKVPTADGTNDLHMRDAVGSKADTASTTVNATTSIIRYIKGLLGLHPVPTANAATNTSMRDVIGNKDDTTNTSIVALAKIIDAVVDDTNAHVESGTYGLSALKTLIDTLDGNVDTLLLNRPKLVERAASTLPQTTQTAYFTVSGLVMISDIVGEVTVEVGGGANLVALWSNPTVGADVALCLTDGLDIDADVVGTMYHITGTLADAMIANTSGAFASQVIPIVVAAGTIDLKCSASKTGQTKWTLYYLPLTAGATIVAA